MQVDGIWVKSHVLQRVHGIPLHHVIFLYTLADSIATAHNAHHHGHASPLPTHCPTHLRFSSPQPTLTCMLHLQNSVLLVLCILHVPEPWLWTCPWGHVNWLRRASCCARRAHRRTIHLVCPGWMSPVALFTNSGSVAKGICACTFCGFLVAMRVPGAVVPNGMCCSVCQRGQIPPSL